MREYRLSTGQKWRTFSPKVAGSRPAFSRVGQTDCRCATWTELYKQVAGEIRRAIADGEAKQGERLPPAKDLAAVLGVNTNTVLRSLRVLRDEGLLEFRRGRGISVAAGSPERGAVIARARELVHFARRQGYPLDELIGIIEQIG